MKCLERLDNIPTNVRHHSIVGVGNYSEYDGLQEGVLDLLQHFFQDIEHIGMQCAASLDAGESVALC